MRQATSSSPSYPSLGEVALLFLRLGALAFGGPAVYIAMMHDETVKRRQWMDDQRFLDLIGATNIVPGPNATEMALFLGLLRAGWPGFFAAGILFIIPGVLATLAVGWFYVTYSSLPAFGWALYGIKATVIAIVAQALWSLGRSAVKGPLTAVVGLGALALFFAGANEVLLIFLGAVLVLLVRWLQRRGRGAAPAIIITALFQAPVAALAAAPVPFSYATLFLTFLKIGSVLYGSGYVLVAFMRTDFVERLGWLTNQQLLDAVAAGQITPGPVFSSAAFVGYLTGGLPGGLLAALGIFLPSFVFVALLSRVFERVRKAAWARAFLDGVNVASLALMAGVAWQLGVAAIVDWFTLALATVSLALLIRYKVNSAWLVLGGALLGLAYGMMSSL